MAFSISITIGSSAVGTGIKQTVDGLKQVQAGAARTSAVMGALGGGLTRLLAPLLSLVSVGAAGLLVRRAVNHADALNLEAQKAGLAVDQFSRLAYAAELAEVSQEQLVSSSKFLGAWFEKTGQTGGDLTETLMSMADQVAAMPDGFEKTRFVVERFGRAGQAMIPLLNQGSQAMREQMEEADRLGATVGPRFGANADQFNDNLTRLRTVLMGMANMLMGAVLPALISAQEAMLGWVKETRINETVVDGAIAGFRSLAQILSTVQLMYQATAGAAATYIGALSASWSPSEGMKAYNAYAKESLAQFKERMAMIERMARGPDPSKKSAKPDDGGMHAYEEQLIKFKSLLAENSDAIDAVDKNTKLNLKKRNEELKLLLVERGSLLFQMDKTLETPPESFDLTNSKELLAVYEEQLRLRKEMRDVAAHDREINIGFFQTMSDGIENLEREFDDLGAAAANALIGGVKASIDAVSTGIWQVIDGTATWGDIFRQVGRSIISDLIKIGLQEVVLATLKKGIATTWKALTSAFRAADVVEANTTELSKTPALATNATLASIGSWGIAVAIGLAAIAGVLASMGAFESGGVVRGGEQVIRVNERGTEAVLNARATAMLGEQGIALLNAGILGASGLVPRVASGFDDVTGSMAAGVWSGRNSQAAQQQNLAVEAAQERAIKTTLNMVLVDSRNSAAAREFLESAAGVARIVEIVREQKIETGIAS